MPPNLRWTQNKKREHSWSLILSTLNSKTGPSNSIRSRHRAEHRESPNAVCRLEAAGEGGWGAAWWSWVDLPSMWATVTTQGHMLGLRRAPRNTHLRVLNTSAWQLSLNATDTTHMLAKILLRRLRWKSTFSGWEESSFQSGAMPKAALLVFAVF